MKPLEEKNYQLTEKDALSIYAKMMHTLDSSEFESFLSEDFSYSSQKVLTDMNSKDEFIEYIRPKLEIIKKTKSSVYAELGVCPAYGHSDCLIMAQGDKSNLLGVAYASVEEGKISGLSLCIVPTPDSAIRSGIYPGLNEVDPDLNEVDLSLNVKKDQVIITEEEFQLKKEQLLNLGKEEFYQILQQAFLNINSQNDTLVLRDYHVDNLILKDHKEPLKQVGLIDFQDALLGSPFYDLASLLEDVRNPLNENEKEELIKYYINMTNENYEIVLKEINFFSLQRNLKILGIFNRLSIRDGKVRYLEYLPATFNFIKSNLKSSLFLDMKKWIEELQIKELQI